MLKNTQDKSVRDERRNREDHPPLRALHVFLAVGRSERFEDAGRHLGITSSAVSHAIRTLEEWLGTPVLDRKTKRPRLTAAGQALFDGCGPAMDRIVQVSGAVRRSTECLSFSISTPPAFAAFRLSPAISEWDEQRSGPRIDVRLAGYDSAPEESGVDVAIRFLHRHDTALPLGLRGWSAFCTPRYHKEIGEPRSPMDLEAGVLVHEEAFNYWPHVFRLAGAPEPERVTYRAMGDAIHVLSAVLAGNGMGILPTEVTSGLWRTGLLLTPFRAGIEKDAGFFALVTPRGRHRPETETILDFLKAHIEFQP